MYTALILQATMDNEVGSAKPCAMYHARGRRTYVWIIRIVCGQAAAAAHNPAKRQRTSEWGGFRLNKIHTSTPLLSIMLCAHCRSIDFSLGARLQEETDDAYNWTELPVDLQP